MISNAACDTTSSEGAAVCSQGPEPLGCDPAGSAKPQRGDRFSRPDTSPFAALRLLYLRRIVGTALAAAGIERATATATWIARNLFDLNPPARKRIEAGLLAAYGHTLSATGQERLARAVFDNIARFWVEVLFARRLLTPGAWARSVRVAEPQTWRQLADDPRPAILTSAYFGNFAVGAYALGRIFRPVHVVIDRLELPVLREWQDDLYGRPDVRPIAREAAVRELPRILDAGGKVMILGDHARPTGHAIELPFLGGTRRCYPTVGVLAARHNARVVVFSTPRIPGPPFRFELRCHDVIAPNELDGQGDPVRAITERYMAALEAMIRETPQQYGWPEGDAG